MADIIIVETKIDSQDGALQIAQALVALRLAAAARRRATSACAIWCAPSCESIFVSTMMMSAIVVVPS